MDLPDTVKILLLDDNPIDREICRRHLGRRPFPHYEFVEHNTIAGARDVVQHEHPDCILLDYHLHDGNGMDFLNELGEIGGPRRFPVVMLTGTGSEAIAVQVMKAGAQDYLVKERLSADILQRTVETAIYKAQAERLLDEQRGEMERLLRETRDANMRKDQFLAALSHELRTPLTPVLAAISATDVLRTSPSRLIEVFEIIRRNVELEARLIDDLLDLTRISRGRIEVIPARVDLHALLHHAAEACEPDRAAKQIRIDWHLDAAPSETEVDSPRIQQVFWNLLKNAIKFTPEGGAVCISTRSTGNRIVVEFADTGIGLQPHTEEKIFDAFVQGSSELARRFGGLGLGLAISKALVEAHGGEIRAANSPDRTGAVFTVELPLTEGPSPKPSERPAPVILSGQPPSANVLLVEDHADSAFFLKLILEGMNYRVFIADRVADAVEIFRREGIDYVVSDLGLPDGSGTDVMERIRAIRPVPGIALSGYGMEGDVQRAMEAGFSIHLTKPTDVQQLADALLSLAPAKS